MGCASSSGTKEPVKEIPTSSDRDTWMPIEACAEEIAHPDAVDCSFRIVGWDQSAEEERPMFTGLVQRGASEAPSLLGYRVLSECECDDGPQVTFVGYSKEPQLPSMHLNDMWKAFRGVEPRSTRRSAPNGGTKMTDVLQSRPTSEPSTAWDSASPHRRWDQWDDGVQITFLRFEQPSAGDI